MPSSSSLRGTFRLIMKTSQPFLPVHTSANNPSATVCIRTRPPLAVSPFGLLVGRLPHYQQNYRLHHLSIRRAVRTPLFCTWRSPRFEFKEQAPQGIHHIVLGTGEQASLPCSWYKTGIVLCERNTEDSGVFPYPFLISSGYKKSWGGQMKHHNSSDACQVVYSFSHKSTILRGQCSSYQQTRTHTHPATVLWQHKTCP